MGTLSGSLSLAAILLGVGCYVMAWVWHDNGLTSRIGTWHVPPPLLKRLVRRGTGPIYLANLGFQIWGLVMIASGAVAAPLNRVGQASVLSVTMLGIVPVVILWPVLLIESQRTAARIGVRRRAQLVHKSCTSRIPTEFIPTSRSRRGRDLPHQLARGLRANTVPREEVNAGHTWARAVNI
jgi:hypothetical protein